jgi:hypothetical protein
VVSKTGSASSLAPPKLHSLAPTNKAFVDNVKRKEFIMKLLFGVNQKRKILQNLIRN